MSKDQQFREDMQKLTIAYQEYEENLMKKQIANGAPRPEAPHFSFARFFNWLHDLEQV